MEDNGRRDIQLATLVVFVCGRSYGTLARNETGVAEHRRLPALGVMNWPFVLLDETVLYFSKYLKQNIHPGQVSLKTNCSNGTSWFIHDVFVWWSGAKGMVLERAVPRVPRTFLLLHIRSFVALGVSERDPSSLLKKMSSVASLIAFRAPLPRRVIDLVDWIRFANT